MMRVGGTTVALVSEEKRSVEAFERALTTTLASDIRAAPAARPDPATRPGVDHPRRPATIGFLRGAVAHLGSA